MILSRSCKSGQKYGIPLEENYTHMMTCLQRYADSGLRTLVMAMKELDEREFMKAIEDIDKAEKVLENREEAKADWWERRRQIMLRGYRTRAGACGRVRNRGSSSGRRV